MNIRLLTFSKASSYGASLQCYALCKVLKNMGHNVVLISIPLKHNFKALVYETIMSFGMLSFRKEFLPPYSKHKFSDQTDLYIVGSDQVWNIDLTKEFADDYFLGTIPDNTPRISYAASIGSETWRYPERNLEISSYLKKYQAISVREASAVSICRDEFGVDAQVVLDPTLLLDDYSEIIGTKKDNNKPILVCFKLLRDPKFIPLTEFIADRMKITPLNMASRELNSGKNLRIPTVKKWLQTIAESTMVITDSFHCTVFAIMFRRKFITIPSQPSRKGRMLELLEKLGLTSRFYNSIDEVQATEKWREEIDYDAVFLKLHDLRQSSLEFLISELNKIKK